MGRSVLFALLVGLACAANAADRPCSKADEAAASKAIDRVVDWGQLRKAWQDYGHCDKGPVADLYTDALMRLMVEWKGVQALAGDVKDKAYHDFVIAHLKSDAAKDDRDSIYSRAKASCPAGLDAFCGEIAEAATEPPAKK